MRLVPYTASINVAFTPTHLFYVHFDYFIPRCKRFDMDDVNTTLLSVNYWN